MTYRKVYGYPWLWAILSEAWWRLEHLPYRGGEGGLAGYVARYAYAQRHATERRGAQEVQKPLDR